jgi:hypothetical protein
VPLVHWTVILNTAKQATALDLLEQVAGRLAVPIREVWLRPWGEERRQFAAQFVCELQPAESSAALLGQALDLGCRLSATWTIDTSRSRESADEEMIVAQAWTPYEYQKMKMEGLAAVSLVVREGDADAPVPSGGVRQRVMAGGVIVKVVESDRAGI